MSTAPLAHRPSPSAVSSIVEPPSISSNWSNHKFTLIGAGSIALIATSVSLEWGLFINPTGWAVVAALVACTAITYFIFLLFGSPTDFESSQPHAKRELHSMTASPLRSSAKANKAPRLEFPGSLTSSLERTRSTSDDEVQVHSSRLNNTPHKQRISRHSLTPEGLAYDSKREQSKAPPAARQPVAAAAPCPSAQKEMDEMNPDSPLSPTVESAMATAMTTTRRRNVSSAQRVEITNLGKKDRLQRIGSDLATLTLESGKALLGTVSSVFQIHLPSLVKAGVKTCGSTIEKVKKNPETMLTYVGIPIGVVVASPYIARWTGQQ